MECWRPINLALRENCSLKAEEIVQTRLLYYLLTIYIHFLGSAGQIEKLNRPHMAPGRHIANRASLRKEGGLAWRGFKVTSEQRD